jgi:AcrR family transcriptional regulator
VSRKPIKRRARRPSPISAEERGRFLEALAHGWSVKHAAEAGGHIRQVFYELRDRDEEFAAAWAEAIEAGTEKLEDEARRRGVDGYDEETFDGEGQLVRRVRRYDSALLQLLLRGRRPDKYRDGAGVALQTPAVFVLESAFGPEVIEAEAVEEPAELPPGKSEEQS